jgi:hypothetical protein
MKQRRVCLLLTCLGLAVVQPTGVVKGEDGGPLLCVPTEAVECLNAADCEATTAQGMNLPHFIKVDLEKKTLTGELGSGERRTSDIKQLQHEGDTIIFQGIENGRSWGIVINTKTAQLVATIAGEQEGFVVFGACTRLARWQEDGTP